MKYYVDPVTGIDPTDAEPRSGRIDEPWKTITFSLSNDSPLSAGDILLLRGGIYRETNIPIRKKGEPGKPIVIKNYKNEEVIIDGSIAELSEDSAWELVDEEKGVYRSINNYPQPCHAYTELSRSVGGIFGLNRNRWQLITYQNKEDLISDHEYYRTDRGYYAGPGIYYGSNVSSPDYQHIFIRLQPPNPDAFSGRVNTFSRPLQQLSPGDIELSIAHRSGPGCIGFLLFGASHIRWEGISFFNHGSYLFRNFDFPINNLEFSNLKIYTSGHGFMFEGSGSDYSHNILFDRIEFTSYVPPWIAWTDVKGGKSVAGSIAIRAINLVGRVRDIEVKNSYFHDCFDGMIAQGNAIEHDTLLAHDISVHHNLFGRIRDDSITLGSEAYNIEIAHNKCIDVSKGVSIQGAGQPNQDDIGKVYIHHNIIQVIPFLKQRPQNSAEQAAYETQSPLAATHSSKHIGISPWKIYNNTVLVKSKTHGVMADNVTRFTLPIYNGINEPFPDHSEIPPKSHEVYNNIFILEADMPIGERAKVHTGREIYDGNIYWRKVINPSTPLFTFWHAVSPVTSDDYKNFSTLEEFKNDDWFVETKSYYQPGWENSGIEADPKLTSDYRPSSRGPAAHGAINLEERGWPGYDARDYRGAMPPNCCLKLLLRQIVELFMRILCLT